MENPFNYRLWLANYARQHGIKAVATLVVDAMEDGADDPVDALNIDEADS